MEAVAPEEIDEIISRDGRRSIRRDGIEMDLADALLPRTGSAPDNFRLAIVRQMNFIRFVWMNFSQAIKALKYRLCFPQILAQNSLVIPQTMLLRFPVDVELLAHETGFPCVVKLLVGSTRKVVF